MGNSIVRSCLDDQAPEPPPTSYHQQYKQRKQQLRKTDGPAIPQRNPTHDRRVPERIDLRQQRFATHHQRGRNRPLSQDFSNESGDFFASLEKCAAKLQSPTAQYTGPSPSWSETFTTATSDDSSTFNSPKERTRRPSEDIRDILPHAYSLGDVIGQGTTATVYSCRHTNSNVEYACKVIDKRHLAQEAADREEITEQLRREVDVLRCLDHAHITRFEEKFENDNFLIIIMERLQGGELFDLLIDRVKLEEKDARYVAKSILSAIQHMHSKGVLHRDLKPENVLLASTPETSKPLNVKLIDFGFAKKLPSSRARTTSFVGTGGYMAPEVLLYYPYDAAVDLWSFGVILYLLLCGRLPFPATTSLRPNQKLRSVYRLSFPSKYWKDVDPSAIDLIQKILVLHPRRRLTPEDIFKHEWMQKE